ncbi:tripartite motif-containing protein 16-like [Anableps anableps]
METTKTRFKALAMDYYAKPEDVACDSCTDTEVKALKSCLVCRVSYCELHLQPHYNSPAFEKHKLVEPLRNLQEKFCSRHEEVMKIFCRTDQQTICFFCLMDEHKDHDTVSAVTERKARQAEFGMCRSKVQLRIQNLEKEVKVLQKEMEAINHSADEAVKDSERIFTELLHLIEKRSSALKEQIRSQQKTEINRVREQQGKLEEKIAELLEKEAELKQMLHSDDHIQFLQNYSLLKNLSESVESISINNLTLAYFRDVTQAVAETCDKVHDILTEKWPEILLKVIKVDSLLPHPEPKTREDFLQYSCQLTLDPNTVNPWLALSDGGRKATVMKKKQEYSTHPDRFTDWLQALSKESLTGRCYWEVERGTGGISVAVAYKDISRTGNESGFGNNDKSWTLGCFDITYYFMHNYKKMLLPGPKSTKIGVFLDHRAGTLSFYSVSDTMKLLHKVQTTFTQPLHAGIWVYWVGDTAELRKLK